MIRIRKYLKALLICVATLLTVCALAQDTLKVDNDYYSKYITSQFQLGVTYATDVINGWGADPAAIARMMHYLEFAPVTLQNTHIMGWGAGNPNPAPGVYDWSSLDTRINRMRENDNAEIVITFCTAPGWMKTTGEDWEMNDRVADAHFDDYAGLCSMIARRYPDVQYFQVWNEFKGFWNRTLNDWDVIKHTEFYNIVYDSVRSARPDAIIGGFYKGFSDEMTKGGVLTSSDLYLIDYWLEHNVGADFIAFDGSIHGWPHVAASEETLMELSSCFGMVAATIRKKTDLPIWVSEYYAANMVGSAQFQAANHASAYYHSLINGTSVGLHWDPFSYTPLFTNPSKATGAQPTTHYDVTRYFNHHFGPGRQLYHTRNSDSTHLEVLSTATKNLLINKRAVEVKVELDGSLISLEPYEVKLCERSESLEIIVGDTQSIAELIFPLQPADPAVQWSSGNPELVSLDALGNMIATAQGKTEVVVNYDEAGFTDEIIIEVNARNIIPFTVSVDISKVAIPHWFSTMYMADKQISDWEFVAMKQDPNNAFLYSYSDTLDDGCEIRPTFAFGNGWGTAESTPTCAQEGLSSRTQVVTEDNKDFTFSWDEFDCTNALDPEILNPDLKASILFSLDNPLGIVPREILGQQLVYNHEADSLWSDSEAYLYSALEDLSTGILRYPGGVVTNYFHWNNPTGTYMDDNWDPGYNPDKDVDPEYWMSVDEYFDLCAGLGTIPLLGVNIESGRVYNREQEGIDEALALVAHAKNKGFEGAYYYLGNEPYVQDKNGVIFSAADYANTLAAYGAAIRAEDPKAELIMGWHRYIAEDTEDLQEIFSIAGDYIDVVDVHWYWNTSQSSIELWRNQQGMTTSAQSYSGGTYEEDAIAFKDLMTEWGYPDVKLATLEYNVGAGNTYTGPGEFELSLMVGEMLLQFINGGVDLACLWPTHFPFMYYAEHENARTLFDHSRNLEKNAMFDIFQFMNGVQSKRLLASYSDNDWVYSVALQDTISMDVDVYLLNRADGVISSILPLTPQFDDPGFTDLGSVLHYVDGPGYRADTIVGSFTNTDGQTVVDLPPFSITLIHLPGNEELYTKANYKLALTVLDHSSGEPLPGCKVIFGDTEALTNAQGKAQLDSLDYGLYNLNLSAFGYHSREIDRLEIISDTTLVFELEENNATSAVSLKVYDQSSGEAVNRAQISYLDQVKISSSSGEVILGDIKTGILVLNIEHSDYFTLTDTIEITRDTILSVALSPKLADIRFNVNDAEGPVNHSAIQLNDFTIYTDASGLAWISDQPARQQYTYSIEEPGYLSHTDTVFLETDTLISIQLEKETGINGHPLDLLKVYPNPARDLLHILSPVDVRIYITGLDGRVLLQDNIPAYSGEINIAHLTEGCYIIKVAHRSSQKFTRIMIIR